MAAGVDTVESARMPGRGDRRGRRLVDRTPAGRRGPARWRGVAEADLVPPDRLPWQVLADGAAEPRDDLPIGQRTGRFREDRARVGSIAGGSSDVSREMLVDGSGTDDEDVHPGFDAVGDRLEEPALVLQPMALGGRLRGAATVADARIVADVAGLPMTGRRVRRDVFEDGLAVRPADEDRLAGVDPDELDAARTRLVGANGVGDRAAHDFAQAGTSPDRTARSAYWTRAAASHDARSTRTDRRWVPAWKLISGSTPTA